MKRHFTLFLTIIMVFIVLSACTPAEKPDDNATTQNYFTTTVATTSTKVVATGYGIGYVGLNENEIEYTGEPIELTLEVNPEGKRISMMLFVDGYLQPYSVDGGETDYFHTIYSGVYTLSFQPVSGKAGETVQFYSTIVNQCPDLDNPANQLLDADDYCEILNEHHASSYATACVIKMNADAPGTVPQAAADLAHTHEIQTIWRAMSGLGDNPPSTMNQTDFHVYDVVMEGESWRDFEEDDYGRQTKIIADKDTEHEMFICGYGKTGKYRVSLFINGEIQYVFDGKAYLDMEIVENKQTTCPITINTQGLGKNNYIYLTYCALDEETSELTLVDASKSITRMLLVE